ncbi:DUF6765 family protein [Cupriavidus sp. MP-37]|uniref:DUF6765 family protein n=1 Tax=Cupriavidus sp. MP-37 TaxID=2884455 RepID=UPI001D0AAC76|nr:DUF6765 family protein [Cupriavidus sp. MP-37]UDM49003.1 hypothetical protein LIN44_10145 [Cupriavidus sp. MP-37]
MKRSVQATVRSSPAKGITSTAAIPPSAPRKHRLSTLLFLAALATPLTCSGFESDVHFGLTYWLAKQAGFAPREAEAIALANQRLDAGSIEYMASPLQFACLSRFAPEARDSQARHYPSESKVPSRAQSRPVVPGGPAAQSMVNAALRRADAGKAAFMLGEFGRSLHALQDSWAHQGTPSIPDWSRHGIECDANLAMAAPADRGTPQSHAADLTWRWPGDVEEMAKSTYAQMLKYPRIHGAHRTAAPWNQLQPALAGFIGARTKRAKADWFAANDVADASFLDGTSLPDGPRWKAARWQGRRDIPAPMPPAAQSGVDKALIDFYTHFFNDWVTTSPVDKRWLSALASEPDGRIDHALVDQLIGWRLRDRGTHLALAAQPHSARSAASPLRQRASFEVFKSLNDAVLPLIVAGDKPSPILPFLVFALPDSAAGSKRAVALIKLLDAPYDTIGVLAERRNGTDWKITALISSADN